MLLGWSFNNEKSFVFKIHCLGQQMKMFQPELKFVLEQIIVP